jgi:putative FmdB family regulatory protein
VPLYEYICVTCGNSFEQLVFSTTKQDEIHCPQCAGGRVNRKLSSFATKSSGGSYGNSMAAGPACSSGGG